MITNLIIVRCAIGAILALAIPTLHTQITRLINKEDFGAWQMGFITAIIAICAQYQILKLFFSTWLLNSTILLDMALCIFIYMFANRFAVSRKKSLEHTQLAIKSFLTNKTALLTTLYYGIGIMNVSDCTNAETVAQVKDTLTLFEVNMSVSQYIETVLVAHYDRIYSVQNLIVCLGALMVFYFGIRWFLTEAANMSLKFRAIFSLETALTLVQYNELLFNPSADLQRVVVFSLGYMLSLMMWWWFIEYDDEPYRPYRRTIKNS